MTDPTDTPDTTSDGTFPAGPVEFDVTYWTEDDNAENLIGDELTDEEIRASFDDDDQDESGDDNLYDLSDQDLTDFVKELQDEEEVPEGLRTSSWHLAPSLVRLRAEINRKWPHRDKRSDGSIGDASHSARESDHNPNRRRSVDAIDTDKDGISPMTLVNACKKHPACNYVIWNRVIYSRVHGFRGHRYTGPNPHNHHIHTSVMQSVSAEQSRRGWLSSTTSSSVPATKPVNRPKYTLPPWPFGDKSRYFSPYLHSKPPVYNTIKNVQRKLYSIGYEPGAIDGMFGPKLREQIVYFQYYNGLHQDGLIGYKTYSKLQRRS